MNQPIIRNSKLQHLVHHSNHLKSSRFPPTKTIKLRFWSPNTQKPNRSNWIGRSLSGTSSNEYLYSDETESHGRDPSSPDPAEPKPISSSLAEGAWEVTGAPVEELSSAAKSGGGGRDRARWGVAGLESLGAARRRRGSRSGSGISHPWGSDSEGKG